ncbi:hypothetical protein VTL71DRAFT_11295 [Oculimacula yallundae]|uniref:SMP domain-containing protein n=1 Tax=Oculimacula yallundae TaxID=86028 RepID=A0ABR4CQ77_9HELO
MSSSSNQWSSRATQGSIGSSSDTSGATSGNASSANTAAYAAAQAASQVGIRSTKSVEESEALAASEVAAFDKKFAGGDK